MNHSALDEREWEIVPFFDRRNLLRLAFGGALMAASSAFQKTEGLENPPEAMTYVEKYSLGHDVRHQLTAMPSQMQANLLLTTEPSRTQPILSLTVGSRWNDDTTYNYDFLKKERTETTLNNEDLSENKTPFDKLSPKEIQKMAGIAVKILNNVQRCNPQLAQANNYAQARAIIDAFSPKMPAMTTALNVPLPPER